ncbi:uncharacterized protein LOC123560550 [Mercenaria mercenaria]|uniref:uncharacterized protein LOC123560550 n=1 Tax=Mercenaria mercenaria TaxID=6596 RepID=UPI00234F3486|nr:uncharacterized protein LOC123560550 [Mercenaria mercenaria]
MQHKIMSWNVIFVKICLLAWAVFIQYCSGANQCPEVASSVGTEFLFGVIGGPSSTSSQTLYIHITAMTDTPAKVRITSPFNNFDNQYTVSNWTIQSMSYTHIQTGTGSQFKGIEINSDVNISVAVFPAYSDYTEGFLVLPTAALSTRYVAASYHPSSYNNEILVAGVDSNSDISINYTTNGKSYSTQNVRLQKFETYQLAVSRDVSGAVITSNKPVAVFSGSANSQIPVGIGGTEYIVEQMVPTKYWSTQFIVPPIYPHNYFIVKVFVEEDNTEIHYYNSTKHFAAYMDQGEHVEILFGSDPTVILSNKPIYVVQYCLDNENMYGQPFMTISQGLSQYESMYKFVTELYSGQASTVAITIKRNNSSGLLLNGKTMASWSAKSIPVAHPMDDYVTIFVNVSYNSLYRLHHTGGMKFGATLYGRLSNSYAYGYPLQLSLPNADCTIDHNISPTSGPIYPYTDSSHGSHGNYITGNGTWCFQCDNMSHLQYCDTVTRCQTQDESCYVQRYTRSNKVHLYRSGCMNKDACQSYADQVQCQECCHGSFCNVVGCGDDGLPNFDRRGPFCFDCEHQGEEGCQTVQMCRPDQVCKIEKYEWGSSYHYIMGCAEQQTCGSKRDVRETHARHAPVCSHCCHSDFCNMNCTAAHALQVVASVGTEFMFGVIGTSNTSIHNLYLVIVPVTNTAANVRITAPFNNYNRQISVTNSKVINLSNALIQVESGSQFKGIEINSDSNISVAVLPAYSYYTEGFLLLPTSALSTRYVAASYHPYGSYNSEVLVAGVDINTDVCINYTTNGISYNTKTVRLQKYETYQLSANYDLSGTVISSNKPVAVFSGSAYSQIPVGVGGSEYIVEQMIPTKYWTNMYIAPPIYPHNYFIVRIFADDNNTEMHYYNSTNHFTAYMNRGSKLEILFGSDPAVLISNKPVSVVQYCTDNENMYGNPFMTTVQGISQYVDSYKFKTESYDSLDGALAITVNKHNASGLTLNGRSMSSWNAKTISVASPMEDYLTLFINVSYNTFFNLHHTGGIKFGATLYGLLGDSMAFGYPLKLALSGQDCAQNPVSTSNTPDYARSTPVYSSNHSDGNKQEYDIGNGTWCFECEDMLHIQYCDKVTKCHNESEVCYVQKYTRNQGLHLYRSGCIGKSVCQAAEDPLHCQQCCNGNFCNIVGCGDDALPTFHDRGPFCFDCAHKGENDICQTVHMCRPDQVCKIDKYEWGSGFHYVMGCAEQLECKSKRDTRSQQARYAPVCSHCCHSDFCNCNMNCTTSQFPQIIVQLMEFALVHDYTFLFGLESVTLEQRLVDYAVVVCGLFARSYPILQNYLNTDARQRRLVATIKYLPVAGPGIAIFSVTMGPGSRYNVKPVVSSAFRYHQ